MRPRLDRRPERDAALGGERRPRLAPRPQDRRVDGPSGRRAPPHRRGRARAGRRRGAQSRSTSSSAPASRPPDVASRFSSRSRSAVSGVRSWCDASATNASCESSSCSSFADGLVERAGERPHLGRAFAVGRPRGRDRRPRRRPRPPRRRRSGRAIQRASDERRRGRDAASTIAPIAGEHQPVAVDARVDRRRRIRDPNCAVDLAARRDRHGDVEQVPAERVASRRDARGDVAAQAPRRSPGREEKPRSPATPGRCRRRRGPRRSTTTTRPPVSARVAAREPRQAAARGSSRRRSSASSASEPTRRASRSTFVCEDARARCGA